MALIYDKSLISRHERGYVASLKLQGIDVLIILLDDVTDRTSFYEEIIEVDGNTVKVPILRMPATGHSSTAFTVKLLKDFDVEAVISLPRKPYLLAHETFRKLKIPLIARFWSIRALKLIDNLKHGAYSDLLLFAPSLITNLIEGLMSSGIMVTDNVMYRALKKLKVDHVNPLIKMYPPAGFSPKKRLNKDLVELARDVEPYVLGVTILSKTGAYLKVEAKPHAFLLYYLAKRTPSINFLVAGSTREEFTKIFPSLSNKLPPNLIFIGRGFTDDTLKLLYKQSIAAITYISNRSISNRLLEALALDAVIITNPIALLLHPELSGSVIVANSVDEYLRAIRDLIKDEGRYEELKDKIRNVYLKYFSPKFNAISTLKIIDLVKNRRLHQ